MRLENKHKGFGRRQHIHNKRKREAGRKTDSYTQRNVHRSRLTNRSAGRYTDKQKYYKYCL